MLISYNSDYDVNVTEYMNTYKEGIRAEYMHESNNKENEAVLENVGMVSTNTRRVSDKRHYAW